MYSTVWDITLSWPDARAANQRAYPKLATPAQEDDNKREAETEIHRNENSSPK